MCQNQGRQRMVILHNYQCFTYKLTQNQGDSVALASAIWRISYHVFNDYCTKWCDFVENKRNYDHKIILEVIRIGGYLKNSKTSLIN